MRKRAVATTAGIVGMVTLLAVLFHWRTTQDDTWGRTTVLTIWGVEREVRMDRDLDGRTDARIRYPGESRQIATHDRPSEIWVDSDFDGTYDVHWKDGSPPVLERRHKSGRLEVLRGPAAELPNGNLELRTRQELGL